MESCDRILTRYFGVLSFLIVLAFLAVIGGMILCIQKKLPKPLLVFLACCLLIPAVPSVYIGNGLTDLHEKDYIVYHGDFTVSERNGLNGNLTLHDGAQTSVRMQGDFPLPDGEHTGYVVYAKRTRLLLAYDPHANPLISE